MAMTAISGSHVCNRPLGLVSLARLPDFLALMKPRVMSLAVFTALVGLIIAPGDLDPLLAIYCSPRDCRGRWRRRRA